MMKKKYNLNRILTWLMVIILFVFTLFFLHERYELSNNAELLEIDKLSGIADKTDSLLYADDIYLAPDNAFFAKLEDVFYYGFVPQRKYASSDSYLGMLKAVDDIKSNIIKGLRYNSNIHSVYLIIDDKTAPYAIVNGKVEQISTMQDIDWYDECFNMTGQNHIRCRQIATSYLHSVDVISVYKKHTSIDWRDDKKVTGYIVINYYKKHMRNEIIAMLDKDASVFVYDKEKGTVISAGSHSQDNKTVKDLVSKIDAGEKDGYGLIGNGNKQVYLIKESKNSPHYYIVFKNAIVLNQFISNLNKTYLGMLIACCLIILAFRAVSYYQYRKYVEAIVKVIDATGMDNEEQDIMMLASHVRRGGVDFQIIADKIMNDTLSLSELRNALRTEQALRSEIEMLYGHAQINSHFLLNTLDTIYWKLVMNQGADGDEAIMIEKLCMILKYSLDNSSPYTSLKEEIENVKSYLDIQQIRKEIHVNVTWDIPQHLLDAKVGKLTMQPILENCIQHGMFDKKEIQVEIKAFIVDQDLYIVISDDGKSMNNEEMRQMNERFRRNEPVKSKHIGLLNVNRRIQMQYGEEYGVILKESEMGGLSVIMRLKYIKSQEDSQQIVLA